MVKNPLFRLWNRFFAPVNHHHFPLVAGFQLLGENRPKLANLRPIARLLNNSRVLPPKILNLFYTISSRRFLKMVLRRSPSDETNISKKRL